MLENMLVDICGMDIFDSIFETLSINLFSSGGKFSAALSVVSRLNKNVIQPIAVMLLFIYFMIALVDKMSSENFTWEQLWRQMAMLLAAKYLIENGFDLLKLLFELGMAVASKVESFTVSLSQNPDSGVTDETAKVIIEGFKEGLGLGGIMKVFESMILFIYLLIPWLLSWIMRLCVSIICYSRIIEIYARATFAPIALSDFFHSGLQSGGWRYLKNFLAVSLQGAMLLVIAVIFSALFKQLTVDEQNLFSFIGTYLAFFASAIMLMFKSLSLTKELLGTG